MIGIHTTRIVRAAATVLTVAVLGAATGVALVYAALIFQPDDTLIGI